MVLVPITAEEYEVELALAYATPDNFTGAAVYRRAECWLHPDAAALLRRAIELARPLGYRFRVLDAFRPAEAQWKLWSHTPDANFLADPRRGSPHSMGAAIDLTLLGPDGVELDMGTRFDAFTPLSHHGNADIPVQAQRNRLLLMGIMATAGWEHYRNEWWHYQVFGARDKYPVLTDSVLPRPMM